MPNLLKPVHAAILLATVFGGPDARAMSVPYPADSHAAKGLVNFPTMPERPFVSIPKSSEADRAEILQSLQSENPTHFWDKHPDHGNRHGSHENAPSEDDPPTGPGDDIGSDIEDTTTDLQPSGYPPITPTPSAIPVPAALWLFVSGLIGLVVTGKSRHR